MPSRGRVDDVCRWCGAPVRGATAWERRYPLPICLACRMGDRVARKAAAEIVDPLATAAVAQGWEMVAEQDGGYSDRG